MGSLSKLVSLLYIVSIQWMELCRSDDFGFMVNMSVIDKLQRPFMPMVYNLMTGQKIHVPTIEGPLLLDIDTVTLLYVNSDTFTVTTDPENRAVELSITNFDILVGRLKVNVHQTIAGSSLSCVYYTTPNISNWNFTMAINAARHTNESGCNMEIYTNRSKVHIVEGHTNFNWEFDSSFCSTAFRIADNLIDIEKTVKDLLTKEIVHFIDRQLQNTLNEIFAQINWIEVDYQNLTFIELCFAETRVNTDSVVWSATFSLTDTPFDTTSTSTDLPFAPVEITTDDSKDWEGILLGMMALAAALCWIWGFCCWFCCRKCYQIYRDSDKYEQKWIERKEEKGFNTLNGSTMEKEQIQRIGSLSPSGNKKKKSTMEDKFNPLPSICNFDEDSSTDDDDGNFKFDPGTVGGNDMDGDKEYVAPLSSGTSYHRKLRHHATPAHLKMYSPLSMDEEGDEEMELVPSSAKHK